MAKKITVIGGSGFVGTNLCRLLTQTRQSFEIIDLKMSRQFPQNTKIGDVRNIDSLRNTISGDIVINLAAVHRDDLCDKSEYWSTNVIGAENISMVCKEKRIKKIVFTSTVAVYGFAKPGTGENGPIKPFNEYGRTKFQAEEVFRTWNNEKENSLIIIRPTVIFGEGNRGNVFNLIEQIVSGRFIMIGRGENKKSMAYVENVTSFLNECINTDQKYGVYNYVDTPDLNMNELVTYIRKKIKGKHSVGVRLPYWFGLLIGSLFDVVAKLTGRKFPVSAIRVKKFTTSTEFTSSKGRLSKFNAPYTLEQGLERTLRCEYLMPDPEREIFYTE